MNKKTAGISWDKVSAYLTGTRTQKWLGDELGVEKNVVANWKKRGHIPLNQVGHLSTLLDVPVQDLITDDSADSSNKTQKTLLSDAARNLILCVTRLDALGEKSQDFLEHHGALLALSERTMEAQHSPHEHNTAEVDRILGALVEAIEGHTDGRRDANR